jgi:hypothetical protein
VNSDGSVGGTLSVDETSADCGGSPGCEWYLEAISTPSGGCPTQTPVQGWESALYVADGQFSIPISIQPTTTGSGSICVYVTMSDLGAGTSSQGVVGSYPYTLPAITGHSSLTLGPDGDTVGGAITVDESGCVITGCAWGSEMLLETGCTPCPAASTVTSLQETAAWQYLGTPGQSVSTSYAYEGPLPAWRGAGEFLACLYIGPYPGAATTLLASKTYAYIGPLGDPSASARAKPVLRRKIGATKRLKLTCEQESETKVVCKVIATTRRYSWRGTATVVEAVLGFEHDHDVEAAQKQAVRVGEPRLRPRAARPQTSDASARSTATRGVSTAVMPSIPHVCSPKTLSPACSPRATSERVPYEPPTAIIASAVRTISPLRSSPSPVGIAIETHSLASLRSSPGSMPITVPPACEQPFDAAAITPPRPPQTT